MSGKWCWSFYRETWSMIGPTATSRVPRTGPVVLDLARAATASPHAAN